MKGLSLLCGVALAALTVPAMAQDVIIADFEAGAPTWSATTGFPNVTQHHPSGGQSGGYIRLSDAGWGAGWDWNDIVAPPAGKYIFEAYVRNGPEGSVHMRALRINLIQDGNVEAILAVPNEAISGWTKFESGIIELTNSPVTLSIGNQQEAEVNVAADLDEIRLVPSTGAAPLALEVRPAAQLHLSGTTIISATPTFGSETYSQVEFDIGNTGTANFVDTAAPFEFEWDTTVDVAPGTSRTLNTETSNTPFPVRVTVTDSNNESVTVIREYTVDNRFNGRQSIVTNGDFSQWQAADGNRNTLPVGWVEQKVDITLPTYGPVAGRNSEAGQALGITMTVTPPTVGVNPDRYALRTEGVQGDWRLLQTYFWGRGAYARLYYMRSTDGGVTYETTQQPAGQANSEFWTLAIQELPPHGIGLTVDGFVALGTHQLGVTPHAWDDVVSTGMQFTDSNVDGWKLY